LQKNQQIEREKREALANARVQTSIAVANVRKKSVEKTVELTNKLKEKDCLFDGIHRVAQDVADEYSSIARSSKVETATLQKTADSRLSNLKKTKERESILREKLDDVMDTYSDELSKAEAEIAMLKTMLGEKSNKVEGLENELAEAKKEIEVSAFCFFISSALPQHSTHTTLFQTLKPWTLEKTGNPKTWDERATQLVVELLSHRTPPASVSANILSVVELLMPNATIVKELPGIRFVRYCRTILAHVSQTLAAYEIALADAIEQSHTDGTNRRQTAFQNFVVRILREGGSRRITLSSCILAEDESAVSIAAAILKEFKHSGALLTEWRECTEKR
jgi:archaellum component FlaC